MQVRVYVRKGASHEKREYFTWGQQLAVSVYYSTHFPHLQEQMQKCYDVKIYPDGSPWGEPATAGYKVDLEWLYGDQNADRMNAELDEAIARIEAVNAGASGGLNQCGGWAIR